MVSQTSRPEASQNEVIEGEAAPRLSLWQRPGLQQLMKFCIVGASSTLIDLGGLALLLGLFGTDLWVACSTISFSLGVSNGFLWNRLWTFRAHASTGIAARTQYFKFFATNLIGLILNLTLTKVFLVLFTGQLEHGGNTHSSKILIAKLCAVPIVVIWNFSAAKFWTFRAPKNSAE
jgi:putative flippase GtrA